MASIAARTGTAAALVPGQQVELDGILEAVKTDTGMVFKVSAPRLRLGADPLSGEPSPVPPDWRVNMERGPCLGTCPTYRIQVQADGSVGWEGQLGDRCRIAPQQVCRALGR